MKEIKITVREKLPETNSSSSHSVVIRMENQVWCKDPLPVAPDGYLYVEGEDFGREWDSFHGPMPKIQYAAALVSYDCKKLARLEKVICSFTGIKGVVWTWIPQWYEALIKNANDKEELRWHLMEDEKGYPQVDHESCDLVEDIFESDEVLKSFLFDLGSTLYLGADGEEGEEITLNYYAQNKQEAIAFVHVELPSPIGRVDIPIYSDPFNLSNVLQQRYWGAFRLMEDNILSTVSFDGAGNPHIGVGDLKYLGLTDNETKVSWGSDSYIRKRVEASCKGGKYTPKTDEYIEFPISLEIFGQNILVEK